MTAPRVSVVIPTLDPGADLEPLLRACFPQHIEGGFEVLILDSGTAPGGLAELGRWPARRIDVPRGSFGHGRTRQLGAQAARGEGVVFLTQDALPADDRLLAALMDALDALPDADGAFARQLPREDADAAVADRLAAAHPPGDQPQLRRLPPGGWASLSPQERLALARYDHVAAAARRAALLARPIPDVPFAEDLAWAIATLKAGRGIAYAPAARVIHSHRRGPVATYRRTLAEHQALAALVELKAVPAAPQALRGAATILGRAARRAPSAPRDAAGEAARLLAELAGQYIGGRLATGLTGPQLDS